MGSSAMIFQLFSLLNLLFLADAARLSFPPSYKKLVGDLNGKAEGAGLGPIAEVDYESFEPSEIEKFKLGHHGDVKSIKEVKSLEEIKNMDEVTDIKEIKSIQQVPDTIAENFIEDEGLVPLDSLTDKAEYEDTGLLESAEVEPKSSCSSSKIRDVQHRLSDMMEQIGFLIEDLDTESGDSAEIAIDPISESDEVDTAIISSEETDLIPFDKDDIVKISPVKSMQEIKSISPIKSIEEVVGIYALTEDQAQRLKDSWSGYEPRSQG